MVWLPGYGEFPMSLSLTSKEGFASIGVKAIGEGTKQLYDRKKGSIIAIRGPYGNSFGLNRIQSRKRNDSVLLVGGGTGMVPIVVLAKALSDLNVSAKVVIAARTEKELPFLGRCRKFLGSKNVYATTNDGSFGFKGFAHEKVKELVELRSDENRRFCEIFSCGPELMMLQIFNIARSYNLPVQFSLERIMKCGIGICGSCMIGRYVLCKDGPILTSKQLEGCKNEFGKMTRDMTGTAKSVAD